MPKQESAVEAEHDKASSTACKCAGIPRNMLACWIFKKCTKERRFFQYKGCTSELRWYQKWFVQRLCFHHFIRSNTDRTLESIFLSFFVFLAWKGGSVFHLFMKVACKALSRMMKDLRERTGNNGWLASEQVDFEGKGVGWKHARRGLKRWD